MACRQAFELFLVFEGLTREVGGAVHAWSLLQSRAGHAGSSAALHVLGRVQANAEDPGPQVLDAGEAALRPPALQKRLLGGVLGVLAIAQKEHQRADQLVPQVVEGAHEYVPRNGSAVHGWGRRNRCLRRLFAHAFTW